MTQVRVYKQRPARRRVQEEAAAERRQADRRSGQARRRGSDAKIYDWLALPTWRD